MPRPQGSRLRREFSHAENEDDSNGGAGKAESCAGKNFGNRRFPNWEGNFTCASAAPPLPHRTQSRRATSIPAARKAQFREIEFGRNSPLRPSVGELRSHNILRACNLHALTKLSPWFHPLCIEHFSAWAQSRTHLEPLLP